MKAKLLLIVLGLQTAWFVGMVTLQEFRLHTGTVVLLETMPVDPRDLLRGDYVTLNYTISTLPASLFQGTFTNKAVTGTPVFVSLTRHGEFFEAERASFRPLDATKGGAVLRGRVSSRFWWNETPDANMTVRVDYGLEQFFVREGTGNPTGKVTVAVSVPSSGNAVIKQVYVGGKPYAEAMEHEAR